MQIYQKIYYIYDHENQIFYNDTLPESLYEINHFILDVKLVHDDLYKCEEKMINVYRKNVGKYVKPALK